MLMAKALPGKDFRVKSVALCPMGQYWQLTPVNSSISTLRVLGRVETNVCADMANVIRSIDADRIILRIYYLICFDIFAFTQIIT